MAETYVVIETADGEVTAVSASDECNVCFVERNVLDTCDEKYREDILGMPGMITGTYEADIPVDFDVHAAWLAAIGTEDEVSIIDEGCEIIDED